MAETEQIRPADRQPLMLSECPDPPILPAKWRDILRWLVAVMDDDDDALHFIASLLSYCLQNNGLTTRQGKAATKIFDRYVGLYKVGMLESQQ